MRVQHNIAAMNSYRNFGANSGRLNKNLEKLSSGYKINRAGDDAAGLAVSEKMRAQITGLEGAKKNAKDGIGMIQTAEGALTEVHDMLNRMYSLAEQSANGTYEDSTDRASLQMELESLGKEIDRIGKTANFNGKELFTSSGMLGGNVKLAIGEDGASDNQMTLFDSESWSGSLTAQRIFTHSKYDSAADKKDEQTGIVDGSMKYKQDTSLDSYSKLDKSLTGKGELLANQFGGWSGDAGDGNGTGPISDISTTTLKISTDYASAGLVDKDGYTVQATTNSTIYIGTSGDAQAALDKIKDAITAVSAVRGQLGAYQNRLEHTVSNLGVMQENIQDAESSIRDTDVAEEMMKYTKNNIMSQASQAMLAQANQQPQGVLQLLQ